ncbi:YeiH family protein [Polaromonas sp. JS666]|uniref:YeiH family protein n=1 Tax=Polaromonas sp. (strain JS666 / ATCC BAA-500) TaxID=296591 RepID=UPI0000464D4D|nr:YeiH family protein [Polaromonas sp. JS666]ABE47059.1 conserved hypothetical protein 698 [Polaromonas sp. JS666]
MTNSSSAAASALATVFVSRPRLHVVPGVVASASIALIGMALGSIGWMQDHGLSALTLAIALGILAGNTLYPRFAALAAPGVDFCRTKVLRLGIVFYGLRLTIHDIGRVGAQGIVLDGLVIVSTFALAWWVGTRWLRMDRNTAILIGVGSSICGAAAVMAAAPVVRARSEQVAVAVATVVVFGTLAMFSYPALYELNRHYGIITGGASGFGVYTGATIHEVAQVVAAGRSVSIEAADTAVIAKMVRVMMLAPFLLFLAMGLQHRQADSSQLKTPMVIPWFAFGFVGMVLFNSLQLLPASLNGPISQIDTALLATAMAALGLSTQLRSIRDAGAKPLLLSAILMAWLVLGGAAMHRGVSVLFGNSLR